MADFKGGRGKRAPYETVMYRIPAPIKPTVEMFGHAYRVLVDGVVDPNGEDLIKRVKDAIVATEYKPQFVSAEKLHSEEEGNDSDEDFDPDIDDDSEPTDAEAIKTQVKNLQSLMTEVRCLNRELAEVEEARSLLDRELNQLHATNNDLNLEIAKLQERLAEAERSSREVEELRLQLKKTKDAERDALEQVISCHSEAFRAASILKAALPLPSNKGGAIKKEIKKALKLIDDV